MKEIQWKMKSDLTSSYHCVANLHSQPQSLSHMGLSEEPDICTTNCSAQGCLG